LFQAILQWEANVILREESWDFSSNHSADTILARITKQVEDSDGVAEGKKMVIQIQGDNLFIKKKSHALLKICGSGTFLFSGKILSTSSGSRVNGQFRMPTFSRILALVAINGFGIWWLVVLSLCLYQILILGDLTFNQEKTFHVVVTALLGIPVSWIGYKLFGFFKYFERGNRQTLESFLRLVAN